MDVSTPLMDMRGITKRFPGVLANDRIDFQVRAGEIHALLGENGAGKTTLMKVLYGLYRPDAGEIRIGGTRVGVRTPQEAIQLGIGMVFQHFTLIPSMTVAENIVLGGRAPRFLLRLDAIAARIAELASRYGLQVDPRASVWQLSVGEQQRVEILKLLYRRVSILILDEPTAVLTPQESRELFQTLQSMANEGHAIIFITHKLDEVMAIAHRITVLRAGRVVASLGREETTKEDLARLMVDREMLPAPQRSQALPGAVVLSVTDLSAKNDKGVPALKHVSLEVRRAEILGIAGVAGNGQRELGEVIVGLRPTTAGRVCIQGQDLTSAAPEEIIKRGVSLIPEDRLEMGLALGASILDNLLLKSFRTTPVSLGPLLDYKAARRAAYQALHEFHVTLPGLERHRPRPLRRQPAATAVGKGAFHQSIPPDRFSPHPRTRRGGHGGRPSAVPRPTPEGKRYSASLRRSGGDPDPLRPNCGHVCRRNHRDVRERGCGAGDDRTDDGRSTPTHEIIAPGVKAMNVPISLARRLEPSPWDAYTLPVLSMALAFLAGGIVLFVAGIDPWEAYRAMAVGAFGSLYGASETLVKATPILLAGLGVALALRMRLWNIGAEGQLYLGAVGAAGVALSNPDLPASLLQPLMLAAAFGAGAAWGLIPALLRAYAGVNEIITTLMLNYIAILWVDYLVYGPWKDPHGLGFPFTAPFAPAAQLPHLPGSRIHLGLALGFLATALLAVLLWRTRWGYEIRIIGLNPSAARYAGMNIPRIMLLVMAVSGGLAGLAGLSEVAGIQGQLKHGLSPGYGYTAIIVAWLARLNPWGVVVVSILLGGVLVGGDMLQITMQLPVAVAYMLQGLILFAMLSLEFLTTHRPAWVGWR